MEENQRSSSSTAEDIGLLDVVVTLAENLKLLIIGPLLVGVCALGVSFLVPQTFQSVAVLQAEQPTASLMVTAAVLDPVITTLRLAGDDTVDEARTKLRGQIKTAVGRNDKLLTVTVSDHSAQQSQVIATALLRQTYQESRPKGSVRARLETQLAEAKSRFKNAQDAAEGVLKRLESSNSVLNGGSELARGYAELLTAAGAAQNQISAFESQLEGLNDAQVVQSPTLPQKASQPKKGLTAIGATVAAGLLLLLFIFMRQAWRKTSINETASAKLMRIRKSLGLK
ncbi:Wzz/FepE/Etk N-terminal domain-containing protein [Polaromonas sp.]|uniref:Wzz/FepE/Etk N-terminal domain-containing protein n=1 Tax=Polaromonas sp. TaxID=1869339 RepID=UPI003BB63A74